MKKKNLLCLALTGLLLCSPFNVPVYATGFDMMNNMNMDMILEQSYHAMDSVGFATDMAMNNNDLNHTMNEMLFFPDILDIIKDNGHTHKSENHDFPIQDAIIAVDNGAWMPEFNNFFNQPTAEIPMDVEMANLDASVQTVPVFQSTPQNTISDLPDSSGMDNNNRDGLNKTSDLHFDSGNNPSQSELEFQEDSFTPDEPGVRGDVNFVDSPDATVDLNWDMQQPPEAALLDAVQPDTHTDMLDAIGGEMAHLPQNDAMSVMDDSHLNNNAIPDQPNIEAPQNIQPPPGAENVPPPQMPAQ